MAVIATAFRYAIASIAVKLSSFTMLKRTVRRMQGLIGRLAQMCISKSFWKLNRVVRWRITLLSPWIDSLSVDPLAEYW